MVVIKKRKSKAYILWESLLALAVFAMIATMILSAVDTARQQQTQLLQEQEVLNVAKMAVQTDQDTLSVNGVTVQVERSQQHIRVWSAGKEVLHVQTSP